MAQKAWPASPALGSVLAQDVLWWGAVTISIIKSGEVVTCDVTFHLLPPVPLEEVQDWKGFSSS